MTKRISFLALVAALAALAVAGTQPTAADPICEDTPYGQFCQDLETEPCNPPDCQDPGVHAWPYPIPQTQQCIDALSGAPVPCDQAVVTVRLPGATSVTVVPTPDQRPSSGQLNDWVCAEYHVGTKCPVWPPD